MRSRLVLILVCVLTALVAAVPPALAADHGHHATTTTTTSSQARPDAKDRRPAKTVHHAKATPTSTTKATTAGGSASTAVANKILNECSSQGQLTQVFTRAQLKKALAIMSASTAQYSNCSDVIHTALAHGVKLTGPTGSGGSGSSTGTIVIIVVVVLLLLAAIFGGFAVRRRHCAGDGSGDGGVSAPSSS
jgi:cobalamin biosynthesis Mg chelatase CobN